MDRRAFEPTRITTACISAVLRPERDETNGSDLDLAYPRDDGGLGTLWQRDPLRACDGAAADGDSVLGHRGRDLDGQARVPRRGRLFMFDSAYPGAEDPAAIDADDGVGVIELGAGKWNVTFATSKDGVDFVRFRRA